MRHWGYQYQSAYLSDVLCAWGSGMECELARCPVMAVPIERGKQRTVNIKSLFVTLFCLLCYVQFAVLHPLSLRPTHSHKVNMWGGFTAATAKCQFHNHL